MSSNPSLPPLPLPEGVSSRQVDTGPTGLSFHILEAGYTPARNRPLIVLLHGFPEIAFSWRKVMPLLASAGFYVVAPDQRGYGRTTGWDSRPYSEVDLHDFSALNLVRDVVLLVNALGYKTVRCIVGHDFGARPAALCALARPDMFLSVVLLTHPYKGAPDLAAVLESSKGQPQSSDVHADLAALGRKHYKWYYSTRTANEDMTHPPQGLKQFLRGYFHLKSASWSGNNPSPLKSWTATELAKLPHYYVMPLNASMPEAVALDMAQESDEALENCRVWLPDSDLEVYASEYARTGFQGGLNWYRVHTASNTEPLRFLDVLAGKRIEVPCSYISGRKDWGTYQEPGALESMNSPEVCADFRGVTIIEGAGHWVPQEKPEEVAMGILDLVHSLDNGR
ncbi:hypothetical protein VTO42DRAFT_4041 [Malbranchea cinnamomea]